MAPSWGWWTRHKLNILESYLQAFAIASKSVDERIYLDLFAGSPENISRETNEPILGSVHRAIAAHPPFTRACLFELPPRAGRLEAALRRQYPGRSGIRVYKGDSNVMITEALGDLANLGLRWAPTFAFIDQYDHEVKWNTLEQIAAFRNAHLTKAEMWILFGTSFYPRGLRLRQKILDADYGERLTLMLGSERWRDIVEGTRRGVLTPERCRAELVNLMRWRLHHKLGYKESLVLKIRNTNGSDLYDMIFATDHRVGERIMKNLYGKSPTQQGALRQHAREVHRSKRRLRDEGQGALFDVPPEYYVPVGDGHEQAVVQEPPHEPLRLSS